MISQIEIISNYFRNDLLPETWCLFNVRGLCTRYGLYSYLIFSMSCLAPKKEQNNAPFNGFENSFVVIHSGIIEQNKRFPFRSGATNIRANGETHAEVKTSGLQRKINFNIVYERNCSSLFSLQLQIIYFDIIVFVSLTCKWTHCYSKLFRET